MDFGARGLAWLMLEIGRIMDRPSHSLFSSVLGSWHQYSKNSQDRGFRGKVYVLTAPENHSASDSGPLPTRAMDLDGASLMHPIFNMAHLRLVTISTTRDQTCQVRGESRRYIAYTLGALFVWHG